MLIIPAIDLYRNRVVRMEMGKKEKIVLEFDNPLDLARFWCKKGARALHLIDLQSAIEGEEENKVLIQQIVKEIKIPIEVGGGFRNIDKIKEAINWGVWRVIVSSILKEDIEVLEDIFSSFSEKVIPSLDWEKGKIAIRGWQDFLEWNIVRDKLNYLGVREIIFTDISRDGTLKGVNIENIENFLTLHSWDIWIAGGISSLEDVKKIFELSKKTERIKGIIVGRALLEGRIDWEEANNIIYAS
ncbi:MAG: HisA/HisF-related TIM barrel protein [Dictyoglomus sp.]